MNIGKWTISSLVSFLCFLDGFFTFRSNYLILEDKWICDFDTCCILAATILSGIIFLISIIHKFRQKTAETG